MSGRPTQTRFLTKFVESTNSRPPTRKKSFFRGLSDIRQTRNNWKTPTETQELRLHWTSNSRSRATEYIHTIKKHPERVPEANPCNKQNSKWWLSAQIGKVLYSLCSFSQHLRVGKSDTFLGPVHALFIISLWGCPFSKRNLFYPAVFQPWEVWHIALRFSHLIKVDE